MNNLKKFIRDEILDFNEYKTVSSIWDLIEKLKTPFNEIIKLDQGENFFEASSDIKKALGNYDFYNYYPDPEYKVLRKAISKNIKIPVEKIMVGSGSDELIDLIFRLTLNIEDKVINFPPTFGMYEVSVKLNRGQIVNIPRDKNFSIKIEEALSKIDGKTKIIIVCSPNNPTGGITPKEDVIKLLKTGKLIMLDEAYAEYSDNNYQDLLKKFPNLIILRTFSKWAGLAGLRLGYLIMDEYLISQLMKIKSPFNVNLAAEIAGLTILKNMRPVKNKIKLLKQERDRFYKRLSTIPYLEVFPSKTNFLFTKVLLKDFDRFKDYLFKKKIIVRYFISDLLGNSVRITIGQKNTNDHVIKALEEFKQKEFDGIIFDMDGVLIDVTKSCRLATLKTINYYFNKKGSAVKVTKSQVNKIKSIPGFNNDWDASFLIKDLLDKKINENEFDKFAKPLSAKDKQSTIYKEIRAIWQTFYLGSDAFERSEGKKAPFVNKRPLRLQEKLLIKRELLDELVKKYGQLAIATSRPRQEAIFAIKQFELNKYFEEKYLVAQEDAGREKPNPKPLIEAKKRRGLNSPVYIGDTINDCLAAKSASIPSIYIGKENLGDYQILDVNQLEGILYENA